MRFHNMGREMQGQPSMNDRTSPNFQVDGMSRLPFMHGGYFFTPGFLLCDHIFSQQEFESEFVAVLGLEFLEEHRIRAQLSEGGWTFHLPKFPQSHIDELIVHTDGCCLFNGQYEAGGTNVRPLGGYGIHFPSLPVGWDVYGDLHEAEIHTIQKAELTAVIRALQLIRIREISCGVISIYSDSKYAVQGLNEWIPRWRAKGYRTAKNHGVVNANLFRLLDQEI